MIKSPNVIFACEYLLGLKNKSNNQFGTNYVNGRNKDVVNMFDYFSNPKKSVVRLIDYYMGHTRQEHYNLILKDGKVASKQDIEMRKNDYKNYIKNSNLWKGIVSFNNEYVDDNISLKDLEQRFAKEVMPKFLKYCGFKKLDNVDYVFSLHTNKKHYHIHLAFVEKKPSYEYRNGKIGYRRLGMLSNDERNYLKRLVQLEIERDKIYTPLLKELNEDIDELKKYFKPNEKNFALKNVSELKAEENILKLGALLKEYREKQNLNSHRTNYNSIRKSDLGKQIISLTKEIRNYLYNDENSSISIMKNILDEDLKKLNDYYSKLDNDNHIYNNVIKNNLIIEKEKYIDNYICNAIINHSLYKYNNVILTLKTKGKIDNITIEDIIQELAYQNAINDNDENDRTRRKKILKNYFSGSTIQSKFPNKYKIEKAIKNINNEMDEATKEFSKLFNYERN